jgi:nucleoid-associated protein YgaU
MSRTRVRRRRLGAGLVSLGVLVSLGGPVIRAITPEQPTLVARHAYTVRSGDTVWGIAERLGSPGADPRPLVDAIVRQNGGATTLTPGETLSVPGV